MTKPPDLEATAKALAAYVGDVPVTDYLTGCVTTATDLVTRYIGTATVPEHVLTRAVIEVSAELYHRRSAPNGVKSFNDLDGVATVRVARDALVAGRPLLDPYLKMAFA